MKPILMLPFALCLMTPLPALGQDFLGQFEDFVEGFIAPPPQTGPRPAPVVTQAPEAAPVPRPRPEGLGDEAEMPDLPQPSPERDDAPEPDDEIGPQQDPSSVPASQGQLPQGEKEEEVVSEPVEQAVPTAEPERIYQAACPAVIMGLVEAQMTPPLNEGICGERSPLTVTGVLVNGRMLALSSPVVTNCAMASALPQWLDTVDGYAGAMLGSPLASVTTGTSYMCRNRNNRADGFTSEHGFANALDVSGFTLEDGRSIGVLDDWAPATAPEGRLLRLAHDAACAGFTTVLGPEANAEHADHLHLDLGCHGAACTARLCE